MKFSAPEILWRSVFKYQGNYAKARQILEEISAVCLEQLGKDHPLTIAANHNLGMTLVTLGEKTGAREQAREFLSLLSDNLENVLAYFPENRRLGFVQNMGFSPLPSRGHAGRWSAHGRCCANL